jgi:hypothetical protein
MALLPLPKERLNKGLLPIPTAAGSTTDASWTPVVTPYRRDLLDTNPLAVFALLCSGLLAISGMLALRQGYGAGFVADAKARLPIWLQPQPDPATLRLNSLANERDEPTTPAALSAAIMAGQLHVMSVANEIEDARLDLLRLTDATLRSVLGEELYSVGQKIDAVAQTPPETASGWGHMHHMLHGISGDIQRIRRIATSVQNQEQQGLSFYAPGHDMPPGDRHAAYSVLGLNPDASEAAAKKVVEGLRQTWHPDNARDDADRTIRTARMTQINAAWDLIRARPTQ